jgi:hypothetical protein
MSQLAFRLLLQQTPEVLLKAAVGGLCGPLFNEFYDGLLRGIEILMGNSNHQVPLGRTPLEHAAVSGNINGELVDGGFVCKRWLDGMTWTFRPGRRECSVEIRYPMRPVAKEGAVHAQNTKDPRFGSAQNQMTRHLAYLYANTGLYCYPIEVLQPDGTWRETTFAQALAESVLKV